MSGMRRQSLSTPKYSLFDTKVRQSIWNLIYALNSTKEWQSLSTPKYSLFDIKVRQTISTPIYALNATKEWQTLFNPYVCPKCYWSMTNDLNPLNPHKPFKSEKDLTNQDKS